MVELSPITVRAINIAVLSFCSLILIVILCNFPRFKLKNRASRIFYAKMLVSVCMIICYDISLIHGPDKTDALNVIMRSLAYVGIYAVYVLYIMYIKEQVNQADKVHRIPEYVTYIAVSVGVVGSLLRILSLFSPAFSEFNEPTARYSEVFFITNMGGLILIAMSVIILAKRHNTLGNRESNVLMAMPILMLIATLCEPIAQGIECRYPAVVLEFLIVYTQHQLELETRHEREETEGLRYRLNMAADRMKPHYLYNVLTTIYYLCDTNPAKAQEAIGSFSDYMKSTLEALEKQEPVRFAWEMQEIKSYLALEKLRFGDKLNVEYDIEYDDFFIPPLTVQPLVENAVRHGVSAKAEGGTVRIISRKLSDGGAQIRVKDDGVGFDVENLLGQDVRSGGIANLRERLRIEVGGELTITSAPGKGTTAIVTIRPHTDIR